MEQRGSSDRTWLLELAGARNPVTRSRDFTRMALDTWRWPQEATDDVLLLVSEVVSNACLHGGGPGVLVLDRTPERLRIEVTDGNPAPPVPVPAGSAAPGRPGGHGMLIVERLARSWGSRPGPDGKCVWLEVGPDGTDGPGGGPVSPAG
ncbi:ATP-binding protein [Streptomyces sp. NPDC060334]|uniref:ATP-binding protein n=1 Tax=unclassified Streptomyces TaxID=2593676 RepID=UPI0006AE3900|nr:MULTISPECIES: ATP-binding protein [unclassified Streptomyces]KOU59716.1 regulator [Streptomyces sp. WM4235]MCX5072400.1 ATP-binding protein [Streptomyces sp. NBC_00424]MCX5156936.1 ATP-binding protein [Streptomyces sp. NBC_00291]WUD44259.1 ATP-binding protein [Streptomyces sp. NBC_00513]